MKPINCYLQEIYEKLGGEPTEKRMSNYYYLDYILENINSGSNDVTIDWSIGGIFCNKITSLKVPNTITSLADNFASYLYDLESITLPSNLETIGNACFGNCINLKEITIPQTVTSIGYSTFPQTPSAKLEKVYLNWTENPVAYDSSHMALPNNDKAVFSIPNGTTAIYESANYPSDKLVEREE